MLPHVAGRPLAIVRCPGGSGKPCFFQKHPGEGDVRPLAPVNVAKRRAEYHVRDRRRGRPDRARADGRFGDPRLGQRRERHLEKPDRLIFDLDPDPAVEWPEVVRAAREVRFRWKSSGWLRFSRRRAARDCTSSCRSSPRTEWDEAKAFCRAVADFMVRAAPDRYMATMSKAARKGRFSSTICATAEAPTAIAPYSTARQGRGPVSVPIAWDELNPRLRSDHFTIKKLPRRLAELEIDPWADIQIVKQTITAGMRKRLHA